MNFNIMVDITLELMKSGNLESVKKSIKEKYDIAITDDEIRDAVMYVSTTVYFS